MEDKEKRRFLDVIMTRRSVRDFKEGVIPPEDLERILQAGIMAPSPGNSQPWRFHIIKGSTKERFIEALRAIKVVPPQEVLKSVKVNPPSWQQLLVKGMEIVPVVVAAENPVFISKNDVWSIGSLLGTAASIQNLLLAVHSLDYGSVWIAFPPVLEAAKETLKIPGTVVGVLPIGHPADHQNEYFNRSRKPLEEVATYYE